MALVCVSELEVTARRTQIWAYSSAGRTSAQQAEAMSSSLIRSTITSTLAIYSCSVMVIASGSEPEDCRSDSCREYFFLDY